MITIPLLPVEPVFPLWARDSERESLRRKHREKRALQIRQMSARQKIITELVRRVRLPEELKVLKDLMVEAFENHLLNYDHYKTRMLFWNILKDAGVDRNSDEQMVCFGRDIIEKVGYLNPEEKEDLAISLFPLVLEHLYPSEEMPRLARCGAF